MDTNGLSYTRTSANEKDRFTTETNSSLTLEGGSNSDSSNSNSSNETKLSGDKKTKMDALVNEAIKICNDDSIGYQHGGNGPKYYDCSGLVQHLYKKHFNITTPRSTDSFPSSAKSYHVGKVGSVKLQVGDVLWKSGHVEVYIGDNKRAGAHTVHAALKDQVSIKTGGIEGYFTDVYRFVK